MPGVGCVFVSSEKKLIAEAKTSCPVGSVLASPADDTVNFILADHIVNSGAGSVANDNVILT